MAKDKINISFGEGLIMYKLYYVNINDIGEDEIASLSPARKIKANSYIFEKDKKLCLAAGLALDRGLRDFGLSEPSVSISYKENGKPYLKDYPHIHFNLSHSGEFAIAVISDQEIGCDIEKVREINDGVVSKCFTEEEQKYIDTSLNENEAFTRIWVYKESFLKAVGYGITIPMNSFSVLPDGTKVKIIQNVDPRKWVIEEKTFSDYLLAVCSQE